MREGGRATGGGSPEAPVGDMIPALPADTDAGGLITAGTFDIGDSGLLGVKGGGPPLL